MADSILGPVFGLGSLALILALTARWWRPLVPFLLDREVPWWLKAHLLVLVGLGITAAAAPKMALYAFAALVGLIFCGAWGLVAWSALREH